MRHIRLLVAVLVAALCMPAVALAADGDGDVGVVDTTTGKWYLRDSANGQTTSFYYGVPGDVPIVGDWDCDGDETPGLYRQSDGFVYLRNSNTQGVADIRFFFGIPGDIPLAGDFNDDGCDTVSIYRPSEGRVYIINELGKDEGGLGAAEFAYYFGVPGDKPFVGDFDDDGTDTIGLHRESTGLVYFRNSHTQGIAEFEFIYGIPNDKIIAADWAQSPAGPETVGIFRPAEGKFYLNFENAAGFADTEFPYGNSDMLPIAGNLGALPGGDPPPPTGNEVPTAWLTVAFTDAAAQEGETVTVNAPANDTTPAWFSACAGPPGCSEDPDGSIVKYEWFLDGDLISTAEEFFYAANLIPEGEVTVTLRVTDDDGAIDTATATIDRVHT